jgi:hypothetical protein
MHLPWYDAVAVEPGIQAAATAALGTGKPVRVALVAADAMGGMDFFALAAWRERLPGYQVHAVPTASWVRPKFVERLLSAGVARVLVVRDARAEAAARDGNRWIADRLAGVRAPAFRPARAGNASDGWRVVDFDPSDPGRVAAEAADFAKTETPARPTWTVRRSVALAAVLVLVMVAAVGPSHLRVTNPEPVEPELIFSFKAFGEPENAPAAARDESNVPVHMRGAPAGKPVRSPVRVRLTIGDRVEERSFAAKGISHDGPAIDVWRQPLPEGRVTVTIDLFKGEATPPLRWTTDLEARPRHLYVVTYDPNDGFRLE